MNSQFEKIISLIRTGETTAAVDQIQSLTGCDRRVAMMDVASVRDLFNRPHFTIKRAADGRAPEVTAQELIERPASVDEVKQFLDDLQKGEDDDQNP